MLQFLVTFDRSQGKIDQIIEFKNLREALGARFAVERRFRGNPDIEVVVLTAASEAALHRTHTRYFENAQQLSRSASKALAHS